MKRLRKLLKAIWIWLTGRRRGVAEMKVVHKDADDQVLQEDYVKTNITFRLDAKGEPIDIRTEEE